MVFPEVKCFGAGEILHQDGKGQVKSTRQQHSLRHAQGKWEKMGQ